MNASFRSFHKRAELLFAAGIITMKKVWMYGMAQGVEDAGLLGALGQ